MNEWIWVYEGYGWRVCDQLSSSVHCVQLSSILTWSTQQKSLGLLFLESLAALGSGSVLPRRDSRGALEDWGGREIMMSTGQLFAGLWAFGRCVGASPWESHFLVPQAIEWPTTAPSALGVPLLGAAAKVSATAPPKPLHFWISRKWKSPHFRGHGNL